MAKRGPLSKVESFYVENNYNKLDLAEIAVDLDRSIKSIENYVKKNVVNFKKNNDRDKPAMNVSEQFIRKAGATVMSENASTLIDETRSSSAARKDCITTIKNE
tara:strand:+ start:197 stop:508 length:312 start_codon:yes stop_codon:yes gene_type:complete